jgi:CheY-like chemotaxis protein
LNPISTAPPEPASVLLAEESLPYRRVIREALVSFRCCRVDDAPSAERAFEMALQRPYQLFIFSLSLPDMSGAMMDRLLARAYPLVHSASITAPPVIFLLRSTELQTYQELQRDVRVRGSLGYPPKLESLLALTEGLLSDGPISLPHVP